jgi:hypothetical protein
MVGLSAAQGIYRIAAYLCILFVILSASGALIAYLTGTQMAKQNFAVARGGLVSYPIEVTKPGAVHEIILDTSLSVGQWAVVEMSMIDDEDQEYGLFETEFWDEEGRDSDGYWHEWDTNHSHLFVPNEAGPYTLEIEMSEATVSSPHVDRNRVPFGTARSRPSTARM